MNTVLSNVAPPLLLRSRGILREHAALLTMVGLHFLAAQVLCLAFPGKYRAQVQWAGFGLIMLSGLATAAAVYAGYVMLWVRPAHLLRHLRNGMAGFLTADRLLLALPVLLALPFFTTSFTIFKAAISDFQPFAWDARFAALDQALHGGVQPWLLLQGILGYAPVSAFLDATYLLWFCVMWTAVVWQSVSLEKRRLRMQFLLSFVIVGIVLGNLAALIFSSAGPCFYGQVAGGPDPYAPLYEYLRQASAAYPLAALDVQHALWTNYLGHGGQHSLSISAMPSMHVATTTLLALLGWRIDRRLGLATSTFLVFIILGSIHLGWHYAIDAYAGALGALAIWLAVGRLPFLPAATGDRHGY